MERGNYSEIAGGSITETVDDDYNIYAGRHIINTAGNSVLESGTNKGVKFGAPQQAPVNNGKTSVITAYFATKAVKPKHTVTTDKKTKKQKTHTSNKTIIETANNAVMGEKVYIVVETQELQGKTITVNILGTKNTTFVKPDEVASVTFNGADTTQLTAVVGAFADKADFQNPDSYYLNKAIIEVEIKPSDDQTKKDWTKKINDSKEKRAYLHLSVQAAVDGQTEIDYLDEVDNSKVQSKTKGLYLTQNNFVLGTCLCDRTLVKEDLWMMGINEEMATKYLDALNQTFTSYTINTCLRRAHFMAQIRVESLNLTATKEFASGNEYQGRLGNNNPGDGKRFKGRGFIQITGKDNYKSYGKYKGEDFITEPNNEKLETSPYCADSAGWYWSKFLPSTDLSNDADKDDVLYCTYRINGGFNGLKSRATNVKQIVKAIGFCSNTDLSTKGMCKLTTSRCTERVILPLGNDLIDEDFSLDDPMKDFYQEYIPKATQYKQTLQSSLDTLNQKKVLTTADQHKKSKLTDGIAKMTARIQTATDKSK